MAATMDAAAPVPSLSKSHRLVFDVVSEQGAGTHLSMARVHELARERQSSIGFTTVYRALSRLRDLGLVCEIAIPGADSVFYEPVSAPHAHFRCDACGRVEDVPFPPEAARAARAAARALAIDRVELTLHGRCTACT
jgi:Fe2+ or Zn2+ uptake regulation protein